VTRRFGQTFRSRNPVFLCNGLGEQCFEHGLVGRQCSGQSCGTMVRREATGRARDCSAARRRDSGCCSLPARLRLCCFLFESYLVFLPGALFLPVCKTTRSREMLPTSFSASPTVLRCLRPTDRRADSRSPQGPCRRFVVEGQQGPRSPAGVGQLGHGGTSGFSPVLLRRCFLCNFLDGPAPFRRPEVAALLSSWEARPGLVVTAEVVFRRHI